MKRKTFSSFLIAGALLAACSSNEAGSEVEQDSTNVIEQDWPDIEADAAGTTVNMYMWGGDENINSYIDDWMTPRLEENYEITLERRPMDTEDIIQQLMTEKEAGETEGQIDVFWLNGENFRIAKDHDLLWGSFAERLPNVEDHINMDDLDVAYDFGTEVNGLQAPWGQVQFALFYNEAYVDDPPASYNELAAWVEENPGRFTYPEADEFTGNAFVRQMLYEVVEEPEDLVEEGFNAEMLSDYEDEVWSKLREMAPHLWREGETYPSSLEELDRMYANEEVWMTMGYNEGRAEPLVRDGTFPEGTKGKVFETGSLGNTHYLSIPFNAPNQTGAMTVINEFLSFEAQKEKLNPDVWGEGTVLSSSRLSNEQQEALEAVERGGSVPGEEALSDAFRPEMDAAYVDWVEDYWLNEVVRSLD
ncbi:putative spermidine/putrescine transport system substrate-binding protein [Salsuginibacillus halophilus]|uniref:Putative spermidine/putrescine transport system substrate-binding protein n=1 Tax=Salsuginibacillus halophilus TaxID=517424 RepID=A0A2P8H8S8_9BACI|nr:ABC transporter substrate-binding protein [Salsuginibacillus halophilus]PSL42601.1 putative spermidine/putrescine transport system substrate-binding protein [Salsuginibacillus halophilus]